MFLFESRQLHRLPKVEGGNSVATSCKQVHPRRYWIRAVPPLLLIVLIVIGIVLPFHWGTLSASLQQHRIQGASTATVSATGLVQGAVYNLTFENPNGGLFPLSEIDVTQGQYVRQGQVLARLDQTLFQRNVDAAHAVVVAAQNRVNVTLARQQRAIKESQALIAEAETNFQSAQTVLRATNLQAQASIAAAQATLSSDQQVLAATQQQAMIQIKAGQAQLEQSIANCKSSSQSAKTNSTTKKDTVKDCIDLAEAQYAQVVATAQTSVITAQAQVTKDQAAIAQATLTAGVAVATAQGVVAGTGAHIPVATYDPDLLVAAKEVAEAQQDLTLVLEQLHTAQLNLVVDTTLVAPHDGIVTAINGTIGGQPGLHVNVAPKAVGSADTTVAIQLVDLSHVNQLLLDVDEADIMKVKVGQSVQFTLKAYGSRRFSGTVSAISPNGVALDSGMAFPVIVSITAASVAGVVLFPNMTAMATIAVS